MEFEQVQLLGGGSFGSVSKMKMRNLNSRYKGKEMVAVKHPAVFENPFIQRVDIKERDLLLVLNHKNLCNLLYYYVDNSHLMVHLVLQLMESGDLFKFIREHFKRPGGIGIYRLLFSYQLFRGLAYCHSQNIVHRDIKVTRQKAFIAQLYP